MHRRKFLTLSTAAAVTLAGTGVAGANYWSNRWKYIVIHHSAGSYGNIEFLRRVHKERQPHEPIDAIAYHYIIGNGNGMPLGKIDHDWRLKWNLWGAHTSLKNIDYSFRGLGICLIGNFQKTRVLRKQYLAAVLLTRKLMKKFSITVDNVVGHGHLKGEHTLCPGKYFPMAQFRKDISRL